MSRLILKKTTDSDNGRIAQFFRDELTARKRRVTYQIMEVEESTVCLYNTQQRHLWYILSVKMTSIKSLIKDNALFSGAKCAPEKNAEAQ